MYDSLRGKLHTYSASFSPKPLIGVRFANPGIVRRFEDEMAWRWDGLQGYLDAIAQRSRYKDSSEMVMGMNLWEHGEAGTLAPERNGSFLPAKHYGLVAVCDVTHVISPEGCYFDHEMEIIFSVKDHSFVAQNVREIMEADLPAGIAVREAWRFYSVDMENGFSIRARK